MATTGAYCYSMSSNYNALPRPAVVPVCDGRARLMVRRETEDDLLARDVNVLGTILGDVLREVFGTYTDPAEF